MEHRTKVLISYGVGAAGVILTVASMGSTTAHFVLNAGGLVTMGIGSITHKDFIVAAGAACMALSLTPEAPQMAAGVGGIALMSACITWPGPRG